MDLRTFPKRQSAWRILLADIVRKRINFGEWLSSLFLVKDDPRRQVREQRKQATLIVMPPMVRRLRKLK
jgi:hypothetical protein